LTLGNTLARYGRAIGAPPTTDLAVVTGTNYYDAACKAVEALGGMKSFVPKGATVGILINSKFGNPGTFAKPQIALAVLALCQEAGAGRIVSLEDASWKYWRRATLSKEHVALVEGVQGPGDMITVDLPRGLKLKKIEIVRDYVECDVLINIPIFKDHEGTHFTGVLKNIMGATSGSTNTFFHKGSGAGGYYNDPDFLSQCIADAYLTRTPTLCVGDGTEMIVTNGPFGPGKLARPLTVVAGTDGIAVDAFGASLLGLKGEEIAMLRMAHAHGLGTLQLNDLSIARIAL
jgi:uncharacterized protein (DUF362 family)